jgi:carboxyl-terminal processing protease
MSTSSKIIVSMVAVILVALAFGLGFTVGRGNPVVSGNIGIIEEAWNIVHTEYVNRDTLNTENLTRSAIQGMLAALDDPYTSYLAPEQYELGAGHLEGEFNGIGAFVGVDDKQQIVIIAPIADSPADKAGIRSGDIIMEIDGETIRNMSLAEAIIKIRGASGTPVTLLILHSGDEEPVEIEIIRARIEVPSVRYEMKGDFAHINITQFSERTEDELSSVLEEPEVKAARGIILDLRGNSGGLLDIVIEVTSHFLEDGIITSMRDNQGKLTSQRVISGGIKVDLPMVVLVDGASASGSELLAGALQDHERAVIAGDTTFGKGSVNILHELSDGSGLYITVARWLTPDGRLIEGQGIEPDIKLEVTGDDAVQWAIDYLTDNY